MKTKAIDPQESGRLERLAALPDNQIDTADIPEAPAEQLRYARRPGRGEARVLPVAVEAGLVEWFRKHHGEGFETAMADVLREHILAATVSKTKRA